MWLAETVRTLKEGQETLKEGQDEMKENIRIILERTLAEGSIALLWIVSMVFLIIWFCNEISGHIRCYCRRAQQLSIFNVVFLIFLFCREISGNIRRYRRRVQHPCQKLWASFFACNVSRIIWWYRSSCIPLEWWNRAPTGGQVFVSLDQDNPS